MNKSLKLLAVAGLAMLSPVMGVHAGTAKNHPENNKKFQKKHPRRTQVLDRTDNQNSRVNKALTNKKLTYQQGSKIKAQDRAIRRQEQADAAANGGHITKAEQRDLNREENRVNREIKRDEAKDAQKANQ